MLKIEETINVLVVYLQKKTGHRGERKRKRTRRKKERQQQLDDILKRKRNNDRLLFLCYDRRDFNRFRITRRKKRNVQDKHTHTHT